jgi:adenylate cyclase
MGLMRRPLAYAYRALGRRYPRVAVAVAFQMAHLVVLAGIGLLLLYQSMSTGHLLAVIAFSQAITLKENVLGLRSAFSLVAPADPWLDGAHDEASARRAWRALAGLPVDFVRSPSGLAIPFDLALICAFITIDLGLPWYSALILLGAGSVVLAYGLILRFFALELTMRPVLEDISGDLENGADLGSATLPLRFKLLTALPAINVITGVVVAALATRGQAHLSDLGVDVLVAVVVAFTISFELTILVSRSILGPIQALREATERVAHGDFTARVSVVSTDEAGALAGSFNEMVSGLQEREKLREAFGTYVDPDLAERILAEGTMLEGQEVEVSIAFLDIRSFTAFAEQASAPEVVSTLNDFFERVVPVITRNGGHANKFVGDGLMAVFGAPDRREDHADRAVRAGLEIARLVADTFGERLRIGIGVNSGPVVAGTIGGGGRLEFTVIGDPVNTAARVEAVTRQTGDTMLITEATRCLLTGDHGGFTQRPTVELKGKTERVALYAPQALTAGDPEVTDARASVQTST